MSKNIKIAALAVMGTFALSLQSASAETMKITFAAAPPPAQLLLRIAGKYYIPTVNKRLAEGGDLKLNGPKPGAAAWLVSKIPLKQLRKVLPRWR
jgi:hypothetical protein